ncbi:hypothetical protein SPI_04786 [Niveomyces insectorum RCEF 264]|uniref:Alternative oxidase n=1 Tax=Niveomyces insectorum RCEF 264 TaxID=1081102 RepID=A0A167UUK3_9HYPO|nr:hypothetical protein SPI_04786 [Niveomyces insectorum RCEF 264]
MSALRLANNLYHATLNTVPRSRAYAYQPLDAVGSRASSPTAATPRHRSPYAFARSRWGKALLVTATLATVCLLAAFSNMPATLGRLVPATVRPQPNTLQSVRASLSKEEYVAAVLRNPVAGVLDPEPIRRKCADTTFQAGLVWHCELVNGGIGNVGNMWLNCLRYALEAGATTVILPRIGARNADDLGDLGSDAHSVDLDTLYDVDYFLDVWPQICPSLRAVRNDSAVANLPPRADSPRLTPNTHNRQLILDPTGWRAAFDAWLANPAGGRAGNMSAAAPVRVQQRIALAHWDRAAEDPAFAHAFARLFQFPEPLRRLAATVLWQLEQTAGAPMVADAVLFPELATADPDTDGVVTSLGTGRVVAGGSTGAAGSGGGGGGAGFLGAHLRRFRDDAAATGTIARVATKEDLLEASADTADERAALATLSWDQQAIVDFEVLVHSGYFAGFVRSSFSWVVAVRRALLPEAGTPVVTKRAAAEAAAAAADNGAVHDDHRRRAARRRQDAAPIVEKYRDGLSVVVGRFDAMTIDGIWP